MKTFLSKKIAQTMVNWDDPEGEPESIYLFDDYGRAVYDEEGRQARVDEVPELKGGTTQFAENLPTVTPSDVMDGDYLVDKKEGELPSEEEEEITEPEEIPEFTSLFQAFRWAKHEQKVIRLYYVTISGVYIIRDIEPHGDFWARTTLKRILVTWDETVGDIRAFRLGNVQKYEFTGASFEPKFNFSQRQHNYRRRMRRRKERREKSEQGLI